MITERVKRLRIVYGDGPDEFDGCAEQHIANGFQTYLDSAGQRNFDDSVNRVECRVLRSGLLPDGAGPVAPPAAAEAYAASGSGTASGVNVSKDVSEPSLWQELRTAAVRLVLPFALVGVATVALGLLVTKVLDHGWFFTEDGGFNRTLAGERTDGLNTITHYGTLFAETPTIVGFTVIAAAIFRFVFHRWHESVFLVLCVSGQALIFMITTMVIDRQRPPVPHLDDSPPTSSFPSGHTAAATAFYIGVAVVLAWHTRHRWLKVLLGVLGAFFPIMVALCRLYRGMHYPSDVSASMLMATMLLLIAGRLFLFARVPGSSRGRSPDRGHPHRVGV